MNQMAAPGCLIPECEHFSCPHSHALFEQYMALARSCQFEGNLTLLVAAAMRAQASETPAAVPITTPFRILDLAPELRNRIYNCIFEDNAPHRLSLFDARAVAPPPAITAVSRRVRAETLGMYRAAGAAFWSSHVYCVSCEDGDYKSGAIETLMECCQKFRASRVRRLEFI